MTRQAMQVTPVILDGHLVTLVPLDLAHVDALAEMAADERIWTYLDEPVPPSTARSMARLVNDALQEQERGERLPFAVIHRSSKAVIGTISYIGIERTHRQVEIGWAWINPQFWGEGVAREAAYLLVKHAFTNLGAVRVAFKTDSRNQRSRNAIRRIGATEEGTLRSHRVLHDGYIRDSMFFSIIGEEWPGVQRSFEPDLPPAAARDGSPL